MEGEGKRNIAVGSLDEEEISMSLDGVGAFLRGIPNLIEKLKNFFLSFLPLLRLLSCLSSKWPLKVISLFVLGRSIAVIRLRVAAPLLEDTV